MAFYGKIQGEWEKFSNIKTYKGFGLVVCDDSGSVTRIAEDGSSAVYTVTPFTQKANAIEIDQQLNAYVVSSDGSFKRLGENGSVSGTLSAGSNFISVALTDDGETLFVGNESGDVRKYESSSFSSSEWISTVGGSVNGLGAARTENVHATSVSEIQRLDKDGNNIWSYQGDAKAVNDVEMGDDGQAYEATRDNAVRKIDTTGDLVWEFNSFSGVVKDVAVNEKTGDVYGVTADEIRKLNSKGNQEFEFDFSSNLGSSSSINTISIDKNGFIYTGQENGDVRKLEDTGSSLTQQWSYSGISSPITGSDVTIVK